MTNRPTIQPPDLTDLPLELDAVTIRLRADQRLTDEVAVELTQLATEVLADWLALNVPDLQATLDEVQVVAVETAVAKMRASPAEEAGADRLLDELPDDLAMPTILIQPDGPYQAAVARRDAATAR